MNRSRPGLCLFIAAIVAGMLAAAPAYGDAIGFSAITDNNGGLGPAIAGQFGVDVAAGVSNTHVFTFTNAGPVASIITHIYVDTGAGPSFSSTTGLGNGAGVSFANPPGGVGPNKLPSENTASPPFTTDGVVKRNAGSVSNGIDPGEVFSWEIAFGAAFDAHAALHAGDLRFGIHVQSIDGDGSDSFVTNGDPGPEPPPGPVITPVPEPTSLAIWGLTGIGIAGLAWRRRMKKCANG